MTTIIKPLQNLLIENSQQNQAFVDILSVYKQITWHDLCFKKKQEMGAMYLAYNLTTDSNSFTDNQKIPL